MDSMDSSDKESRVYPSLLVQIELEAPMISFAISYISGEEWRRRSREGNPLNQFSQSMIGTTRFDVGGGDGTPAEG